MKTVGPKNGLTLRDRKVVLIREEVKKMSGKFVKHGVFTSLAGFTLAVAILACNLPGTLEQPGQNVVVQATVQPLPPLGGTPTMPPLTTPPSPIATTADSGLIILHQPFAIILAFSGPETGIGSALYTPMMQASQKAIEDFGLIHGFGVNLIGLNDNCTEAGGADVAGKVAADEHIVALLGPVCSTSARGALPILEDAQIVMISGGAREAALSTYGPSVFHRTLLDDVQALALGYPSQIYIEDLPSVQIWLNDFAIWGGMLLETGLNHFTPYQYDATLIMLNALEQSSQVLSDGALQINRETLRTAVRSTTNYAGITGNITFDSKGDRLP